MLRVFASMVFKSGAIWLIPFAIALEIPSYFDARHLLGRDWTTSTQVANSSVPLLMILAAVAGCLLGASWRRHSALVDALPGRGLSVYLFPPLISAATMASVHLVYVLLVLILHAGSTIGRFELLPYAPVFPALLAFSLIGTLAAGLTNSRLIAPFLGILLYGLLVIGFGNRLEGLLSIGGAGVELTGMRLDTRFVAAQTLWFVALSILLVMALAAFDRWAKGERRPSALMSFGILLVVLCMGTAAYGVGSRGHEVLVRAEVEWNCSGSMPELCAVEGHTAQMEAAAPRIKQMLPPLTSVRGFPVRDTYRERLGGSDDGSGAGQLAMRDIGSDRDLAFRVIAASYLCSDDWTPKQLDAADTMAAVVSDVIADDPAVTPGERSKLSRAAAALRC